LTAGDLSVLLTGRKSVVWGTPKMGLKLPVYIILQAAKAAALSKCIQPKMFFRFFIVRQKH